MPESLTDYLTEWKIKNVIFVDENDEILNIYNTEK